MQAQASGLEDVSGDPPSGLLNSVFRAVDLPRALVFNAVRVPFDRNMGFDEFVEAVGKREGFGELSPLVMQEDDSGIERLLKGAAAFAGDVATDPLSLVSFGATSVGKKVGARSVQAALAGEPGREIAGRAVRYLGDKRVAEFSRFAFSAQARDAIKDGLSDEARTALEAIGKAAADDTIRNPTVAGAHAIGDLAAEAFQLRGATGLRKFLTEGELPEQLLKRHNLPADHRLDFGDAGRAIWEDLPTDMRGGLRIRVPFAREEGVRKAILVAGGGGRFAETMGLAPVVARAHDWRNAVRASKAAQAMSRTLGGANGDIYGKMVADLVHGPGGRLEGMTYGLYRTVTQAQQAAKATRKAVLQTGNETLARIQYSIGNAGGSEDVKEARKAFHTWVHDPEELNRLRDAASGLEVDEDGRLWLDLPEGARLLSANEVVGLQNAALYHDTLRDLFVQSVQAGVRVEELNDYYLPRALTKAKKEELSSKRVGALQSGSVRGMNPTRRREQFVELVAELDEEGVVRTRVRHLSPEEANERQRLRRLALDGEDVDVIDFFETDPGVMLSRYVNAMSHIASEARFAQAIKRAAGVQTGDVRTTAVLKARELAEAQVKVDEAAAALDALPLVDRTERINEVISDAEHLRSVVTRLLSDPTVSVEEQVQTMGDVIKAMDGLRGVPLPKKGTVDDEVRDALKEARRLFRSALGQAKKATTHVPEQGEIGAALSELGLSPVTRRAGEPQTRLIPPELDSAYAPEVMRQAITRFYEMSAPKAQSFADKWYRPYHAMFKMTATVGRGPGFHVRNVVGGMWNNHLIGVTERDYWDASRLVKARVMAGREARKLEAEYAIKRTGATRRDVTSMPGFEEAVNRRAEEILERRLRDVSVTDDLSLYDVHRLMVDHEIDWRGSGGTRFEDEAGVAMTPIGVDQALPVGRVGRAMQRAGLPGRIQGTLSGNASQLYTDIPRDELSAAQRGVEKLANLWWIRFNAGAAEMSEAYIRGAAFVQGLRQYGDPEVAKVLPLATQFDYADLSEFERKWLRGTLVPFYTWTRHNVPLQVRGLIQSPGKMNRLNLLLDNAEEAFGDDDADVLPEWMRNRFMFISRFKFDGNPLAFGVESPAQDLNEWFKVGRPLDAMQAMAKTLMSATNPAFSIPMQIMTGTEFFTGARLDENTGRLAPWWYQRLPNAIAPTWVSAEGDIMGDARLIVAGPGAFPWLGQSEKILAILGLTNFREGTSRQVSDTIRQLFPVVTAGTLTPQSEAGELFQRAARLRSQAMRYARPEDAATVQTLKDAGLPIEQISLIMENMRARRRAQELSG